MHPNKNVAISRRKILTALASVPFVGVAFKAYAHPVDEQSLAKIYETSVNSFADLLQWLNELPVKQLNGSPTAVCEATGEPYFAYALGGWGRPGDEDAVEAGVAKAMKHAIAGAIANVTIPKALDLSDITIHWRERLEMDVDDYQIDDPVNGKFVRDPNKRAVKMYCRLTVSA